MATALPACGIPNRSARRSVAEHGSGGLWPVPVIEQHPSVNFSGRRGDVSPDMVVLHYTAMATGDAACARLCDPQAEVSAHYLICETGRIRQLVAEEARAWHAGAGSWGAVTDVNSRSIGIEMANRGDHPFAQAQMAALEALLADILRRWAIPPERVIGHSDMAPARKCDPGPRFDWRRLARQGLGVWYADDPVTGGDLSRFRDFARIFGYTADVAGDCLLAAFRARFRPWARGPLAAGDLAAIRDLARRFPVDGGAGAV